MGSEHLLDYFAVDIYPRKHLKMEFIFLPSKCGSNMAANATLNSLRPKIPCGQVCLLPTDIFLSIRIYCMLFRCFVIPYMEIWEKIRISRCMNGLNVVGLIVIDHFGLWKKKNLKKNGHFELRGDFKQWNHNILQ